MSGFISNFVINFKIKVFLPKSSSTVRVSSVYRAASSVVVQFLLVKLKFTLEKQIPIVFVLPSYLKMLQYWHFSLFISKKLRLTLTKRLRGMITRTKLEIIFPYQMVHTNPTYPFYILMYPTLSAKM